MNKIEIIAAYLNVAQKFKSEEQRILNIISEIINDKQLALLASEIVVGIREGKLQCVKVYKERTGTSLMDAKKTVEEYFNKNNISFRGQDVKP